MFQRFSQRNNANTVVVRFSINQNNDEIAKKSDRNNPGFTVIESVIDRREHRPFENEFRVVEIEKMLANIISVFRFVPVKFHRRRRCSRGISQRFIKLLVGITISPVFALFERPDDRMRRVVEVLGRMFVGRAVAAADVPAGHAHTQVDPVSADLQAIFAAIGTRRHFVNFGKMLAAFHNFSLPGSNNSIFGRPIYQNAEVDNALTRSADVA
jgi:hypothetical protein